MAIEYAYKTTRETSIRDQFGNAVLDETYVYNGSGYERISWSLSSYNTGGQLLQSTSSNNEISSSGWNGDQKTFDIDSSGTRIEYTYDSLSRIKTSTKKGIAAGGGFPAQVDIVTTYNYDAHGRILSTVVAAGGLTISTSSNYDPAGRILGAMVYVVPSPS